MAYHNNHRPGEMIDRIDSDVNALGNFFSQLIIQILANALFIIGIIIVLSVINWRIGAALSAYSCIAFFVLNHMKNIGVAQWKEERTVSADFYGFLEERLAGTEDIRACNAVTYVMRQFHVLLRRWYKKTCAAVIRTSMVNSTSLFFTSFGVLIVLIISTYFYLHNQISIGEAYISFHYSMMLVIPLATIVGVVEMLQTIGASVVRVQEFLSNTNIISDQGQQLLEEGGFLVDFCNVSFSYNVAKSAIKNITFHLEKKESIGLIGKTGSGKTTISRLLFRLYDIPSGDIKINGTKVTDIPLQELRSRIGLVTQSVRLFNASLRDNITLFNESISDLQIKHILDELGILSWLERFSDGLNTILATEGRDLSAGEAQLLAFARVYLLKDPGLIILDEASSRLDPITDFLMQTAISNLLRDCTSIVIAHKLSTLNNVDKVMILDNGQVIEYGMRRDLESMPSSHLAKLQKKVGDEVFP